MSTRAVALFVLCTAALAAYMSLRAPDTTHLPAPAPTAPYVAPIDPLPTRDPDPGGLRAMMSHHPATTATENAPASSAPRARATAAPAEVAEDQPGFDCRTMGGHDCGPGVKGGPTRRGGTLHCPKTSDAVLVVNTVGTPVCRYPA